MSHVDIGVQDRILLQNAVCIVSAFIFAATPKPVVLMNVNLNNKH